MIATKANGRTANAAKDSLGKALEVAFRVEPWAWVSLDSVYLASVAICM